MALVIVVWPHSSRFAWEFNAGGLLLWSLLFRPSRKEVAACEGFVLKDHLKQKHHVSCHKDVQKKDWGTWKKLRLLKMDQAAKETSYREIKKVLQGLESSMTYLLGQERRRRLNNQSRIWSQNFDNFWTV